MSRIAKIAVGSAQFGLDYGVSNRAGMTPFEEVRVILDRAAAGGVRLVDTAADYGEAERVLARAGAPRRFALVSKTTRLTPAGLRGTLERARESVERLGAPLYGLMVHSAADLEGPLGAELWRGLQLMKAEQLVDRIGVSAYAADDPVALAERFEPDLMQLPASLADQRLTGAVRRLAGLGVEVHLRSIFLQGLLAMPPEGAPPGLAFARPALSAVRASLDRAGVTPLKACLDFALAVEGASRVVVGVTSAAELGEILAAAEAQPAVLDWPSLALNDDRILDPQRWNAA